MPSSTSSSDIDYRGIPAGHAWLRHVLWTLPFLLVILSGWELLSRSMGHTPGTYEEDGELWAQERRKLDDPDNDIRIVLLSASRLLYAADLDILEESFGSRPLQLALPGTSPALFVEDVVNNTDFDGLIILGVTPIIFSYLDEGFLGEAALNSYRNFSPSRWVGYRIHRFASDHLAFLDEAAFGLFNLIDHYVILPSREGAQHPDAKGWKLSNFYADRQVEMWAPAEIEGSFDNEQVWKFWRRGFASRPPLDLEAMLESSMAFYQPLVEKLRARGGEVILVRMPGRSFFEEFATEERHRERVWEPMVERLDVYAIHSLDYPDLSTDLEIPEGSHLSRASQDDFSRRIGEYIKAGYAASRGRTLDELIHPDR